MAILRDRAKRAPDLKAETVSVLLGGWAAHPPDGVDPGPGGFGGGFIELYDRDGIAQLWTQHEGWLREQARQWGWTPTHEGADGRVRFFGEHIAAGFSEFEADYQDTGERQ